MIGIRLMMSVFLAVATCGVMSLVLLAVDSWELAIISVIVASFVGVAAWTFDMMTEE